MKIDISKIYILDQQPNSTAPNRFWYDLTNNQLKRYDSDSQSWKLTNTTSDNVILTVNSQQVTLTAYLNSFYQQLLTNETNISTLSSSLSSKANDTSVVHLSGNETIGGVKSFTSSIKVVDDATTPNNTTTVNNSGVSVTGSRYTTSIDYQGISFNSGRLEGILSDFTSKSNTTVVNSEATYSALVLKQDKTDNTLNTASKTIVGAINELNTKLLADVPAPITNVFTSTSTSLTSIITDSTKANIQGKILISPNINNLGAVYVGQSITDKSTAFPLYPNQIVSFSFTDITSFKVATDVIGDKFNYVIEFGILNAAVTPAEGLIIVGTDGSKYRLNPSGDTGSETFTLTKIS